MREIGSEFWDVPTTKKNNTLLPQHTQWFLSGRVALQAIVKDLNNCNSVAIPSWCCHSMVAPFIDAGITVCFYSVYYNGTKLIQELRFDCDALLVMDYFGYTTVLPDLSAFKGTVIRDVTHSLFTMIYSDSDYYFGSLRKWCGFWTGGYAWTNDEHELYKGKSLNSNYIQLREKAMALKASYIYGAERINDYNLTEKGFLKVFDKAESCLEKTEIMAASGRDIALSKKLDIDCIKTRRRSNAKVLMEAFRDYLIFSELTEKDCPLFVPILVPAGKRDRLRQLLIHNNIYCPVHWPISAYHYLDKNTVELYNNELSLVCDQRYDTNDMERIVKVAQSLIS